jgi:hypothetical protein
MSETTMIKGHELFQSLSFEEVERVSSFAGPKHYEKGGVVFRKGDRGSHFSIVLHTSLGTSIRSRAFRVSSKKFPDLDLRHAQ